MTALAHVARLGRGIGASHRSEQWGPPEHATQQPDLMKLGVQIRDWTDFYSCPGDRLDMPLMAPIDDALRAYEYICDVQTRFFPRWLQRSYPNGIELPATLKHRQMIARHHLHTAAGLLAISFTVKYPPPLRLRDTTILADYKRHTDSRRSTPQNWANKAIRSYLCFCTVASLQGRVRPE